MNMMCILNPVSIRECLDANGSMPACIAIAVPGPTGFSEEEKHSRGTVSVGVYRGR